jgi:carboxylesterase
LSEQQAASRKERNILGLGLLRKDFHTIMEQDALSCLLLHGYGGSPFEMEYPASRLEQAGYHCRTVCLPGHGTCFEDFSRTRFADWKRAAEKSFVELEREGGRVVVIGLSMGGSLGLHLAQRFSPAGLVTIAAPVFLYKLFPFAGADRRLPLIRFLRHLRPVWPGERPGPGAMEIAPSRGYEGYQNLHCLHSLMEGLKGVRRELGRVQAPLLTIHCPTDRVSPVENACEIMRRVSSTRRRLELLPIAEQVTRHHLLTTHIETRSRVAELCVEHVRGIEREG